MNKIKMIRGHGLIGIGWITKKELKIALPICCFEEKHRNYESHQN